MEDFKVVIDKDIPIANTWARPKGDKTKTLMSLEIGHSFWVPEAISHGYRTAGRNIAKKHKRYFSQKKEEKDGIAGFRFWRVPDPPRSTKEKQNGT